MKTNLEKLQEWIDNARKEGLQEIDLFPGPKFGELTIEGRAAVLLTALIGPFEVVDFETLEGVTVGPEDFRGAGEYEYTDEELNAIALRAAGKEEG